MKHTRFLALLALSMLAPMLAFSQEDPADQIESLLASEGEFSKNLIEPLIALGRQHVENGNATEAEDALRRAQHIIHRNEGVHALRQLEIVELMTELHLSREAPYDADREQQLALYITERNYGSDSTRLLPALSQLAAWYADTGQFFRARRVLERQIDIIEDEAGDADPRLIEPLIESARIRRLQRICCSYRLLEDAREIAEQNPDMPAIEKAEVFAELGDAYIASGREDRAREAYATGWDLLGADLASARFAEPAQIATSEDLEKAERATKRVFRVDQDPLGFNRYREMSVEERLGLESQPPQQFLVPLTDTNRSFHIKDTFTTDELDDKTRKIVGQPFQFILPQLQQLLPLSAQNEADLADLEVELAFTVREDGRVSDVEVDGDVPIKLKRLMRKVMYKATFRPRLVDGQPVATTNYRLTQTFY